MQIQGNKVYFLLIRLFREEDVDTSCNLVGLQLLDFLCKSDPCLLGTEPFPNLLLLTGKKSKPLSLALKRAASSALPFG